ncbi:MAG: hypothetical protein ACYSUY_08425 [Planctomycetota bacterium]|jgi:hypothetical protein
MKVIFYCYVILYMMGVIILSIRLPFAYRLFYKCMREKHPQRLGEFWLVPGSILNPLRAIISLYKEHDIEDTELIRLLTKARNSWTFCFLWSLIGFLGLCLLPFIFGFFEVLRRL